jgi:hypothetical protein
VNTAGGSLRLLHVRIDSFPVFSEYVLLISANSETILCIANNPNFAIYPYAPHIIRIHVDTFWAFSIGSQILFAYSLNAEKGWGILGKKFTLTTMLGDFKGTEFQKNQMGGYILAFDKVYKFYIWLS